MALNSQPSASGGGRVTSRRDSQSEGETLKPEERSACICVCVSECPCVNANKLLLFFNSLKSV